MKPLTNLGKWIAKLWAPIAILLGMITTIVQFVQLWQGDQETITKVLSIGGALLILVSLYYIGFSLSESPIIIINTRGNQKIKRIHTYGEKLSKAARTLFFLSLIGVIALWGMVIRQNNIIEKKIVVLIANFDGPNPENYRVTEQLLSQLSNSLSSYDDTIIIPLNKTITEQEGSNKAQDLGRNYRADLVIWGWYGVTESDVLLTIHVENLSDLDSLPLLSSNLYGMQLPAYEIKSFQIQQRLSSQMTALTLFLGGLIRYEAGDYPSAINRLSGALDEQWPDNLMSQKYLFYYRGLSYLEMLYTTSDESNLEKSIIDFSNAIEISTEFLPAYYYRAICYASQNDFENARKDYQLVIDKAPANLFSYAQWAYLSQSVLDTPRAIEYFTLAIESNPDDFMSFYNRGLLYFQENQYDASLADFNQAINLIPKLWLPYCGRAEVYRSMGEYELALKDLDRALEVFSSFPINDTTITSYIYFERGQIYISIKDYQKALEELSQAIDILPDPDFYFERGFAYLQFDENEKAVQDLSTFLQYIDLDKFSPKPLSNSPAEFNAPSAYYYRGRAFENLDNVVYAFIDYETAAALFAQSFDSFSNQDYADNAGYMCDEAISSFQERMENSENQMIRSFATKTIEAFQADCSNLDEPFPTGIWQLELIRNPIIPNLGMAGIKIGDPAQLVSERLGDPSGWYITTFPSEANDRLIGVWPSDTLWLIIYFSSSDQKVIGFSLIALTRPPQSDFVPIINDVTIGSSEEDLLTNWGIPTYSSNSTPIWNVTGCNTGIYDSYDGIGLYICEEDGLIHAIEIPSANRQ